MNEQQSRLRKIILAGDAPELESFIGDIATSCYKDETQKQEVFPTDLFETALELLDSSSFKRMEEGGHHLLMLFEYEWGRLDEQQKRRLLDVLEKTYGEYADWMCTFVASELLGRFFSDHAALLVAKRLRGKVPEEARSLLPTAFEKFLFESTDQSVKHEAGTILREMEKDTSPEVRSEVRESLRRLEAQGIAVP